MYFLQQNYSANINLLDAIETSQKGFSVLPPTAAIYRHLQLVCNVHLSVKAGSCFMVSLKTSYVLALTTSGAGPLPSKWSITKPPPSWQMQKCKGALPAYSS